MSKENKHDFQVFVVVGHRLVNPLGPARSLGVRVCAPPYAQGVHEMETVKDNVRGPDGRVGSGEVDVTKNSKKAEERKTTENERKQRSPPPERPRA